MWFSQPPSAILKELGIATTERRARELENLFDGDLSGYYYLEAASDGTDTAAKIVLSWIAEHLNSKGLAFTRIHRMLPPDYLRAFIAYSDHGKFDKAFSREIFAELLRSGERFADEGDDVPLRRMTGAEALEPIIASPRFKVSAEDEAGIVAIVDLMATRHPDKVFQAATNPKLLNWFIGEAIKEARGEYPAARVRAKVMERLGG